MTAPAPTLVIACVCAVPASLLKSRGTIAGEAVLYVDDDAAPGGDGKTWEAAFQYLQDALASARKGKVAEIRIAQGTYKPDDGNNVTPGDINAAFDLVNGISHRGGYGGIVTRNPDARDVGFVTILSGDLLGDDGPDFTNYDDNSYRVVRGTNTVATTLLEGVTIRSSNRNVVEQLYGGGLYANGGFLTVRECHFERNLAYRGAGFAVSGGQIVIAHCRFINNQADHGGAGSVDDSRLGHAVLEDCLFSGNTAFPEDGGALDLAGQDIVRRCTFANNTGDDGGAIRGGGLVEDTMFVNNDANYGGAVAQGGGTYIRCRFVGNHAGFNGGAYSNVIAFSEHHARFIDCAFIGNTNGSDDGGAVYGGEAFVNCHFLGNRSGINGGGQFAPGGAIHSHAATTLIANCIFSGNTSPGAGGAIDVRPGNVTTVINSTFTGNSAAGAGEAINGQAIIRNSVFGQHPGAPLTGISSVDYSCLPTFMAGQGNIAADPRFVNALGPDGIAGTEDDDLRLRADSPCIDAADTTALPADQFDLDGDGDVAEPLPLDAFGNCRVLETPAAANTGIPSTNGTAVVDMGAHEYRRPADIAPDIGDGIVNVDDLITVILQWGPCQTLTDLSSSTAPDACLADIDGDGEVSVSDLIAVILSWG